MKKLSMTTSHSAKTQLILTKSVNPTKMSSWSSSKSVSTGWSSCKPECEAFYSGKRYSQHWKLSKSNDYRNSNDNSIRQRVKVS